LKNAKESLGDSGVISIKTYQVELNEFEVEDLRQGRYAKLTISDSGPGMSNETMRRCLEPFYTTRNKDARTGIGLTQPGLGLSAAFSTIRKFNGALTVQSSPGAGTTVSIFVPIHENSATSSKESSPRPERSML